MLAYRLKAGVYRLKACANLAFIPSALWPQEAEAAVAKRLKEAALDNQELRAESARLQHQNNRLQGYALDDAGAEQLSELIGSLTQVGCQCSSHSGCCLDMIQSC